jgi:translation initiation factor IF-3
MTRYDVLNRIDRTTHRLIQVGEAPGPSDAFGASPPIPVCKIQSKKEIYLDQQRKNAEAKEKKRVSAITSSVKTLELNWAIDGNDLGHRLERMREFLEEGRKVEVVLAAKKRGRKASAAECEGVLRRIRNVVEEVEGSREERAMVGTLGAFTTLAFVGRPLRVGRAKEAG